MANTKQTPHAADMHEFPCDSCGSNLNYAPGSGAMRCTHCGAEQPLPDGPDYVEALTERDYHAAIANQLATEETEETRVVSCSSCGAQVDFQEDEHADECPFCASPIVIGTGLNRHIKPSALLPFALAEREAHQAMDRWLGSLWFAPNGLQQYAKKGRKLQGVYVPFWTFDADTRTEYQGKRGIEYQVTTGSGKNRRSETRVRWSNVRGRVTRMFDDVLILGSRTLPKRHTDALAPWDLTELTPYQPSYLAGFRSEVYQVEITDGYQEARQVMDQIIRDDIRRDIGGDRQRITDARTTVQDVRFKHVLLPVWIAAYRYRGKAYQFVVNGRTGRVQGDRPWSIWKIAFAALLALLVAAAISYGIVLMENV
jgi:DNA-directed RNA polymerase subunit RPC12/RpoP